MKYLRLPIRPVAWLVLLASMIATPAGIVSAQGPPPGGPGGGGRGRSAYAGKWWTDPFVIRRLSLTTDQQGKIEDIFQQSRLKLIDLTAALQKEEAILEPLLATEHPSESAALAQVDRVAEARASLEKANSRMLVAFRTILTLAQWNALQSPDQNRMQGRGRPPGPGR